MLATWSSDNSASHFLPKGSEFATTSTRSAQLSPAAPAGIEAQFELFMLHPDRVRMARRRPGEVKFEDSEQSYARRRLLEIEQIALNGKLRNAQNSASIGDKISQSLHKSVHDQVEHRLSRPTTLFSEYIGCTTTMARLFSLLDSDAGSITQITPLIASIPWMEHALINVVNTSAFRRRDAQRKSGKVKQLRTALSYLGMDNLAVLIPKLLAEHIAPASHDQFPKLYEQHQTFTNVTCIAAVHLARYTGQSANSAALLTTMYFIARSILSQMFFAEFDTVHKTMLNNARLRATKKQYAMLSSIAPSAHHLQALIKQKADVLCASLLGVINIPCQAINETVLEMTGNAEASSPLTKIIVQARQYAKVRMLYRARLLNKETGKFALRSQHYPAGSLEMLKSADLFENPAAVMLTA